MSSTTTAKPDPKPARKPRQTAAQKKAAAAIATAEAKLANGPTQAEIDEACAQLTAELTPSAVGSTGIESTPDDEGTRDTRQVMPNAADRAKKADDVVAAELATVDIDAVLARTEDEQYAAEVAEATKARVSEAARASAARRAANATDRVTAKSLREADSAARRAKIEAFHDRVVELFRQGKTIQWIAAQFENERTGKLYDAGTIRWILVKRQVIEGSTRTKFSLDSFDDERRVEVECAFDTMSAAAAEHGISVSTLVKAFAAS